MRPPRLFKDQSKLSFDYVPDALCHREEQLERLWMLFRPVLEGSMSQTAFLIGSVGTGKTATSKRFCLDLMKAAQEKGRAMDFIMVNCRQRPTEVAVLRRIVMHFDENFPDRGFSSEEMLRSIRRHLEKRKVHLVVVLDEADVLLAKGAGDLVYQLTRFDEETVGGRPSMSVIMISQKNVLDMLDAASSSTFRRANAIRFDRYSVRELADILRARAELAFYPGTVRPDSLDLMADIAGEFGDARFAIELLDKAGMLAEEEGAERVAPEHVRGAKALTYSVVTESKLEDLDKQHRLVLLAVARAMKDQAYVRTPEAEAMYRLVAEEHGERPRGHTMFWTYLQDLTNQGLVGTRVVNEEAGGRTTYISLPDVPAKVIRQRLEEGLGD
ncbi:MAG TPA: AAA family ATPase [Methanomassiliicoccales archaeon]|nr:AAA family ATPase [Methanomassiliicoccales archaeon]HRU10956.1 AAA family ATPase [Methanomassiliicoccales archaeon]